MEGWTITPGTRNCCKLINAIVILRLVYSLREKKNYTPQFSGTYQFKRLVDGIREISLATLITLFHLQGVNLRQANVESVKFLYTGLNSWSGKEHWDNTTKKTSRRFTVLFRFRKKNSVLS